MTNPPEPDEYQALSERIKQALPQADSIHRLLDARSPDVTLYLQRLKIFISPQDIVDRTSGSPADLAVLRQQAQRNMQLDGFLQELAELGPGGPMVPLQRCSRCNTELSVTPDGIRICTGCGSVA